MSFVKSVPKYVALQPQLAWRRKWMRRLIRTLGYNILWHVEVDGAERVPATGAGIVMINHLSLLDPVVVMGAVMNRFVVPMSKIENQRNPLLAPLIWWWGAYFINRSEIDRRALNISLELLRNDYLLLIAPEGTRQRDGLVRPKDGLAYLATKGDAFIIPAAITGAAGWEKKYLQFDKAQVHVQFGRPFRFKTGGQTRIPREVLAAMSDEAMYQLALTINDETLRGEYRDVSQATTNYIEFISTDTEAKDAV